MLKPKRKITRDQIKNDSFVETIFDIRSYVMDNSKLLSRIGGGFVVLLLLIVFLGQSSKNNKREAEFLLTQSNVYLDNGDSQNAKIILQELIDEYGNFIILCWSSSECKRCSSIKLVIYTWFLVDSVYKY